MQSMKNRQGKRRSLARSGLGGAQQIAPGEQMRNGCGLNGSRRRIALRVDGAQEGFGEAEFTESHLWSQGEEASRTESEKRTSRHQRTNGPGSDPLGNGRVESTEGTIAFSADSSMPDPV